MSIVKMVRGENTADVHIDEVQNYEGFGWVLVADKSGLKQAFDNIDTTAAVPTQDKPRRGRPAKSFLRD